MYKHILIATDGSPLAGKGVAHGVELASKIGAAVTIVTVTETWSSIGMAHQAQQGIPNAVELFDRASNEAAQAILVTAQKMAQDRGVPVETLHIPHSHPAEGIIQACKDLGCDLIVMASHGRRGVQRLFLGSQASEVLAHTTVPALIVR